MDESLISRITPADVAVLVSRSALQKAYEDYRQARVGKLSCVVGVDDETSIRARVRGAAGESYEVEAFLTEDMVTGGLLIDGWCSCPTDDYCKHVAALLLSAIAGAPHQPTLPGVSVASLEPPAVPSLAVRAPPQPTPPPAPPPPAQLAPQLTAWLDELARADEASSEDYAPEVRDRLVYLLEVVRPGPGPGILTATPVSTRLLKDGSLSATSKVYTSTTYGSPMAARFVRPSDRKILRSLELLTRPGYSSGNYDYRISGEDGGAVLEAIIATGRGRWGHTKGPTIVRGEPRTANFRWRLGEDAAQHAVLEVEGEGSDHLLPVLLTPPWYIDETSGVVGPLETGMEARTLSTILSAPPVGLGEAAPLRERLASRAPTLVPFGPPDTEPPELVKGPPVPRLVLSSVARYDPYAGYYRYRGSDPTPTGPRPIARLSFRYGETELSEHEPRPRPLVVQQGRVFEVVRNKRIEKAALKPLEEAGFRRLSRIEPYRVARDGDPLALPDEPDNNWYDFLFRDVPRMQAEGWEVVLDSTFPIKMVRPDGPVEANLREGSGIDWLELDLGVYFEGERFELTPALLAVITDPEFDPGQLDEEPSDSEPVYMSLPDGRTLAVPATRVWHIVRALYELFNAGVFGAKDREVRFSPFDAAALALMEAGTESVVWRGGERLRKLGEMLRATDGIPRVDVPASFTATLRPYQASGVDWLQFLRGAELGAVLADDMGLGKTVQTLAHLVIEKESGRLDRPALIVCPTSVVPNWRQEAARFAPSLRVLALQGPTRKTRFAEIATSDIVITTYPLLSHDRAVLSAQEWHVVVLDEAQAIKNPESNAAKLARQLKATQRLCLTGTPVENHLGELWSLFSFLSPGFLGDRTHFNRNWRKPIETEGNEERRKQLARRVRPFLLRRTKGEVASELPPKTEIIEHVEMEPAQRDVYETVRLAMHERVREAIAAQGVSRSHIILLDALLKMRQVCCDPRLLKIETAKAIRARSAKFDRLMEMLPELIEDGRRVLLFSQFTSMLALIEEALTEANIPYVLLTGDTRDRETPVRQFQAGEVPLFLVSLKAGGVGLNLTAADTVIHYDPWWNPAVEQQATDRAHRIGQDKPVFVYRLVTLGSIEEKMETLKERKRVIAAGIFDTEGGSALELSEADIEELFAPA